VDNGERRPSNSTNFISLIKPIESKGKTWRVKKVSLCDDNNVEKLNKPNFYTKKLKSGIHFFSNKLTILLIYKEAYLNTNDFDFVVPSMTVSLLQKFDVMRTSLVDYHY
jgi:hypothetical protein